MKNRSLVIAIMSLSLILALATGFHVFYNLFLIAITIYILSIVWAYFNTWGIIIEYYREYGELRVGAHIRTHITLHNTTIFPKLNLSVTDLHELSDKPAEILLNVPAHNKVDITLTVLLEHRGIFSTRGAVVKSIDPLDLHHLPRGSRLPREFIVFPKIIDIKPFALPHGEITGEGASERTEIGKPNQLGSVFKVGLGNMKYSFRLSKPSLSNFQFRLRIRVNSASLAICATPTAACISVIFKL